MRVTPTMKKLDEQIAMIDRQIQELQIKRQGLTEFRATLAGEPEAPAVKKRVTNVKPMVLDIMREAGAEGATSAEVYELARQINPAVGRDTISSVLSRLKGDGALSYSGERYYEKQYAPSQSGWGATPAVVN
jgi:hypothetical protein